MNYPTVIVLLFVGFAIAEASVGQLLQPGKATARDWIIETVSGLGLPLVVIPGVFTIAPALTQAAFPSSAEVLVDWPWWLMFAILLFADDFTHYLYHRASHGSAWLWRLHRAHHSAPYMSIRVTYRNNILFYAMMPGLWLSAVLVHLGFSSVYYWYAILKMLVVIAAHSAVSWDAWLAKQPRMGVVVWILRRVVSTPTTHSAHHGRHATDPGTYYAGNYGNFLFVWDMVLGTGKVNRERPSSYGLENVPPASWAEELLWPVFGRRR